MVEGRDGKMRRNEEGIQRPARLRRDGGEVRRKTEGGRETRKGWTAGGGAGNVSKGWEGIRKEKGKEGRDRLREKRKGTQRKQGRVRPQKEAVKG